MCVNVLFIYYYYYYYFFADVIACFDEKNLLTFPKTAMIESDGFIFAFGLPFVFSMTFSLCIMHIAD